MALIEVTDRVIGLTGRPALLVTGNMPESHRASVLVVDDDEAIREVIAEVLRDEGYDVVCAANGEQALFELKKAHHPDLVLLDLMMPVMSGWEVLEELQGSQELSQIPVVVVSAMSAPGIHEHLAKPIDLHSLLATVGRLTASTLFVPPGIAR
jgi:two-component system, OmpR family, alkaline phosphatase synthesis response regulator PhoP